MKTLEELVELSSKEAKFHQYLVTKYDLNREGSFIHFCLYCFLFVLARWAWLNTELEDPLIEKQLKILCITWNMAGRVNI